MRIIVVGYGRVGARTARVLVEEGHDVTLVEILADKAERARKAGLDVIVGDGSDEEILKEAGVEDADAVGGLTGDPNINYQICVIARQYGCRTVMRVSEDFREDKYRQYADAVDEIIYPERLGAAGAKTALLGGNFNAIGDLTERLQVTVLTVPEGAPVVGERVSSLSFDRARVYAHGPSREPMTIPLPGTEVAAGDRLALVVETDAMSEVREALLGDAGGDARPVTSIEPVDLGAPDEAGDDADGADDTPATDS
jgi:trk system potassium uptake protein TrkA